MYLRRINNSRVDEIPMFGGKKDTRPIKGSEITDELYPNIFLLGKKKSGKTTTIFHILKNKIGKKTRVTIISASLYNDEGWKNIRIYLDEAGVEYDTHLSVVEGEGKSKRNVLSDLVNRLSEEAEEKEIKEKQQGMGKNTKDIYLDAMLGMGDEKKKKKEKKEKYQYPKEIIILDDLGKHMRNPAVGNLLIKNRHYKSLVMLSGQHFKHLEPESRENINMWLVFKDQPVKALSELYEAASVNMPFKQFISLYKTAMKYEKSFFYVNATDHDYRISFSHKFEGKFNI
jgi:hypothetical protein